MLSSLTLARLFVQHPFRLTVARRAHCAGVRPISQSVHWDGACGAGWQVVTASVGDTRCVMYPNARGEAGWEQLSNDHTAERPMENMRVQMAGARVARETVVCHLSACFRV
jgi:serine/threonine protein phosphatase PrpC